jgi:hypothetical protein
MPSPETPVMAALPAIHADVLNSRYKTETTAADNIATDIDKRTRPRTKNAVLKSRAGADFWFGAVIRR